MFSVSNNIVDNAVAVTIAKKAVAFDNNAITEANVENTETNIPKETENNAIKVTENNENTFNYASNYSNTNSVKRTIKEVKIDFSEKRKRVNNSNTADNNSNTIYNSNNEAIFNNVENTNIAPSEGVLNPFNANPESNNENCTDNLDIQPNTPLEELDCLQPANENDSISYAPQPLPQSKLFIYENSKKINKMKTQPKSILTEDGEIVNISDLQHRSTFSNYVKNNNKLISGYNPSFRNAIIDENKPTTNHRPYKKAHALNMSRDIITSKGVNVSDISENPVEKDRIYSTKTHNVRNVAASLDTTVKSHNDEMYNGSNLIDNLELYSNKTVTVERARKNNTIGVNKQMYEFSNADAVTNGFTPIKDNKQVFNYEKEDKEGLSLITTSKSTKILNSTSVNKVTKASSPLVNVNKTLIINENYDSYNNDFLLNQMKKEFNKKGPNVRRVARNSKLKNQSVEIIEEIIKQEDLKNEERQDSCACACDGRCIIY